jgi:hypothetical protein
VTAQRPKGEDGGALQLALLLAGAKKPSGSLDVEGVRSIWVPTEKRDQWRDLITGKEVRSVEFPGGGSGALLADEVS